MPEYGVPPHAPILKLATGTAMAHALYAVTDLGVPDLLAHGPVATAELAEKTDTEPSGLSRVLRTLAAAGYFHSVEDRYALTDLGRTLVSGHPTAARELVLSWLGPAFTDSMQRLSDTLRTGRTGVDLVYGLPVFEYFARHPEEGASFNRTMIAFHGTEPAAVARAWDLTEAEHVVDVGGGVGTLLRAVLEKVPAARGTLFDRPDVIGHADLGDARDRCRTESGDFFASVPHGGDVYLLSHIVHDWKDEEAHTILRNCRRAMADGGRLVLVEMVLPPGDEDHPGKFLDLVMLSLTGGRERTEAQYRDLLARAGFDLVRVLPTDSAVSIIEAVPATST
ncbi:methyltransferase [Streptomyces parvulus]|uniref:Methyltransferase n=1 Tax=Streptomyces parvulus TaxID=146923 RepID=A0A369UYE9_9ACTN|nr:methyltransferase [Streptomyces parvulus]RDD85313.1 methyltransferase [Streptomyces parvulus]